MTNKLSDDIFFIYLYFEKLFLETEIVNEIENFSALGRESYFSGSLIIKGLEGAIKNKRVTYDFHRLMDNAVKLKCSEFGKEIVSHM